MLKDIGDIKGLNYSKPFDTKNLILTELDYKEKRICLVF